MRQVYINLLFILTFFLSSLSFAETATKNIALPSVFIPIEGNIALAPTSVFLNQANEKIILENIDNRFIIVHFWASWCMECNAEMVALNNLQKEFRKKALLVMTVSEDFKGFDAIEAYYTKHKIDYLDIYLDSKSKVYNSLMLNHLPVTYLIDFNGKVIAQSTPGKPIDWDDQEIRTYLEDKVSKYSLLPPEYKKVRTRYEAAKPIKEENVKQRVQTAPIGQ